MSIPAEQMPTLINGIQNELEMLKHSLTQLNSARERFTINFNIMNVPKKNNVEALIPLSNSVYTNATITEQDNDKPYLIDIGTGYYVERSTDAAKEYYKRKVTLVESQMQQIQKLIGEKKQVLSQLAESLKSRKNTPSKKDEVSL